MHECSHGVRKGHRQHQARHELREQCRTWHSNGRVDADVSGLFDHLDWGPLRECIQQRVSDGGMLRRLGTWLHAGVLEAGALMHPDKGPPQGGGSAPMFAKVCLHHVLDAWFVKDVRPRMPGRGVLRRCADALIIGFALEADARRVMDALPKRCARDRLTMHPAKTVWMAFKRPPKSSPIGRRQGELRLARIDPLLGQDTPWILGHQAEDGRETPAPVSARDRGMVSCKPPCATPRAGADVRSETAWLLPILWETWPLQEACSGLRAYRACLAILAEQAQPQGPEKLAEVGGFPPSETAAAETQEHSQHLAGPGTAKGCAKRGVACVVRHWRKLLATEAPDEGNLHVRVCGEGAG